MDTVVLDCGIASASSEWLLQSTSNITAAMPACQRNAAQQGRRQLT